MRIIITNRSSMRRETIAAISIPILLTTLLLAWPAGASAEPAEQSDSTAAELNTAPVNLSDPANLSDPDDLSGPDEIARPDSAPAAADRAPGVSDTDTTGMQSIEGVLVEEDSDLLAMEAQIQTGEYDLPEAWLNARIARIERNSHRFNPELVRPLTLLGDIEAGRGNYNEALDHYSHAVHVQRVSGGLVSPAQVEIVHREADVYRNLGDMKNANEREEYAYHVLRRAYAAYDQSLLPGVYRLAEWYRATNNIYAARALYQRSVDILTANGRGDTPEAIPALEGLAMTYKLERFPPYLLTGSSSPATFAGVSQYDTPLHIGDFPRGEQALQQIVQINRNHGDDPVIVAESVLNLADWFLLFNRSRRANPLYEFAYDLLNDADEVDVVNYFAEPRMLHFPAPRDPSAPTLGSSEEPVAGYVELRYNVTANGFVRSLKTEASQPEGMMDFRVRKSLRASRYRPAIVDGVPIKSTGQIFRHEFTYYPTATRAKQVSAETEPVQ